MNILKLTYAADPEPVIDDQAMESMKEQEVEELLSGLVSYVKSLELQVVELRNQVNKLTPVDQDKPFPEPHSDLYEAFDQYAAYPKFEHILKQLK